MRAGMVIMHIQIHDMKYESLAEEHLWLHDTSHIPSRDKLIKYVTHTHSLERICGPCCIKLLKVNSPWLHTPDLGWTPGYFRSKGRDTIAWPMKTFISRCYVWSHTWRSMCDLLIISLSFTFKVVLAFFVLL